MMKKHGFTLAEVLITLSIIGVVATMTLPALMTNTQEQQAFTGLKKGINTLTEAAQMNNAIDGWDFASANGTPSDISAGKATLDSEISFTGLLYRRASVDLAKGVALPTDLKSTLSADKAVYFKDGSAVYYSTTTVPATATNAKLQDDNLPLGYVVYYDTNGVKGPNILSNCGGAPLGADETQTAVNAISSTTAKTACETAGNKVIKDIFTIRIRGTVAEPEGNASVYVMSSK